MNELNNLYYVLKKRAALEKEYGSSEVFAFAKLYAALEKIIQAEGRTAFELYSATAGEIEARDAAKRADYTAEQRKSTRPDIDRTDVVFAEDRTTSYSIGVLENGNTYVIADRKVITGNDVSVMRRQITSFFNKLLGKNGSIDIPTINGDVLTISKSVTASKARDSYKSIQGKKIRMSDEEFAVKLRAESHIDELAEISQHQGSKADTTDHRFAKDGFYYRTAYFEDLDGQYYKITLSVGKKDNVATVYNIGKIEKDELPSAKLMTVVGSKPLGNSSLVGSVSNQAGKVNTNSEKSYQLTEDSEGSELSEAQAEFFKSSAIRDEDGRLLRVYHGTSENFTVFDSSKGRSTMDIQGMFFSPWELDAAGYGESVGSYYLNITNPAPESVAYAALRKFKGQNDAGRKAREYLIQNGYDGVNNSDEEYIAFYPEQIKRVDNRTPTGNTDIRYQYADYDKPITLDEVRALRTAFPERKSIADFTDEDIQKTAKWAYKYYKQIGNKSPFFRRWFGEWRAYDKTPIRVANRQGKERGIVENADTHWHINISSKVYDETLCHNSRKSRNARRYLPYLESIIKNAVLFDSNTSDKGVNSVLFHSLYAIVNLGDGAELLKLSVEEMYDRPQKTLISDCIN